jgi:hypothetical protein
MFFLLCKIATEKVIYKMFFLRGRMTDKEIRDLACDARKRLEEAIMALLSGHDGLTNSEIAEDLDLHSSHEGGQKDYLTYSILGILMEKGKVEKIRYCNSRSPIYRLKKTAELADEKVELKSKKMNNGCNRVITVEFKKRF